MSGAGLSYGLNLTKKQPVGARPVPGKRKPIFGELDDSDGDEEQAENVEEIGEFGGLSDAPTRAPPTKDKVSKFKGLEVIRLKKPPPVTDGDLSTSFSSKKHADTATKLDGSIYQYDEIYHTLKPARNPTAADKERKPKYMAHLKDAAKVRERDATVAEEKKLAREREAEGDEFADKEKFVTSAYKKQQEEARRLEREEKLREAEEAKRYRGTGMAGFFKNVLDRGDQRHAEIVRAAEERAKAGGAVPDEEQDDEATEKTEADLAREINEKKAGAIAVNDEGQVVDKRQLLKGGLNIIPSRKAAASIQNHATSSVADRSRGDLLALEAGSRL